MTESEVFLSDIILNLPDLRWESLESSAQAWESSLQVLPTCREVKESDLKSEPVISAARFHDVPSLFLKPGAIPQRGWYHGLLENQMCELIEYRFSDGHVLNCREVFYHDYFHLVPRHLLPILLNTRMNEAQLATLSLVTVASGYKKQPWVLQAEQTLLAVLLHAGRHLKQSEMRLWLTSEDRKRSDRSAFEITTVGFEQRETADWVLQTKASPDAYGERGRAELRLNWHSPKNSLLNENFVLDLGQRSLLFHQYEEQWQKVIATYRQFQLHRLAGGVQDDDVQAAKGAVAIQLHGHSQIHQFFLECEQALRVFDRKIQVLPSVLSIDAEDIKPSIFIRGDRATHFALNFECFGTKWAVYNFPQRCLYLIGALRYGIGGISGANSSSLAYKRKGIIRERDIKFLKHAGVAQFIFLEAVRFAQGKPQTSKVQLEKKSEFFEYLYARLGAMIGSTEAWVSARESLDKLCSKNVLDIVQGFVQQVWDDLKGQTSSLYLRDGECRLHGVTRPVILFFHAIVSDLATETKGVCFEKTRSKAFDEFFQDSENIQPDWVAFENSAVSPNFLQEYQIPKASDSFARAEFFALADQGFEIFLNGKVVEELADGDFRPEFEVNEEARTVGSESEAAIEANRKIDWFELHPRFFFKGTEISGDLATQLTREGMIEFQGKFYRLANKNLPSLQRLEAFWTRIKGGPKSTRRSINETFFHVPRSEVFELLALRSSGIQVKGGPRWQEICAFYDQLDSHRAPLELPKTLQADLKPYQKVAVQWLSDIYQLGLGGILADDMGLGKTVTTLAFLEHLRVQNKMGQVLIVVPTSLTYNWVSETQRFTPGIPIHIFQSKFQDQALDFMRDNPNCILLTTYGLLQEQAAFFDQVSWQVQVFDEAQNLKNISAKRTTAARQLRARFKVCLTGTPLENHLGEFYSLVDLVVPEALGSLSEFREKYVSPEVLNLEEIRFLRLKTKPLVLRRTKSEILSELPEKIESTLKIPFEPQQMRIYRDIATAYNQQIKTAIQEKGEAKSQLEMLTALLRLRQVCSDPAGVPNVRYTAIPPKVTVLLESLQEIVESGESALVFTQFLSTFQRIEAQAKKAGIPILSMHGGTSRAQREKILQEFRETEKGMVLLMTLKTGGVGLNLTKASYIFHIEPWWNPAVENQATDRAHRIGQEKKVQVYRYLISESVEEKIEILKDRKSQRFDALFSNGESVEDLGLGGSMLSQSDFELLLGQ